MLAIKLQFTISSRFTPFYNNGMIYVLLMFSDALNLYKNIISFRNNV